MRINPKLRGTPSENLVPDQVGEAACRYVRRTYRDGARVRHETLANPVRPARAGRRRDRGSAEGRRPGPGRAGDADHPILPDGQRRRRLRRGRQAGAASSITDAGTGTRQSAPLVVPADPVGQAAPLAVGCSAPALRTSFN